MRFSLIAWTTFLLSFGVSQVLSANERLQPERAFTWRPTEYPEATLHARIQYLQPEREWERMDIWVPHSPAQGKLPCVVAVFGGGYGDRRPGDRRDNRHGHPA